MGLPEKSWWNNPEPHLLGFVIDYSLVMPQQVAADDAIDGGQSQFAVTFVDVLKVESDGFVVVDFDVAE